MMARACAFVILFFIVVVDSLSVSLHQNIVVKSGNDTSSAMILPLYFSNEKYRGEIYPRRRSLVSNARMYLYDDLLLNGYYTTRLWIGTPPQKFALIVDTGSTVTYVPCSTCEQCGKHEDPRFQPDLSSTYQPVKCNIDCPCDAQREQCVYERQYAEMSSSSGVLGEDIVSFGNQSQLEPQRAVFGCENMETGDLYSQHADGIMGLGRGDLSIVDQLVEKGVIGDSFSLCYGGMDVGGGTMVLGKIEPPVDMVFAHSNPVRSPYYNIELRGIHVAGKALSINPSVFDAKHGTVLDSGTTYAYLPEEAFKALKEAIFKEVQPLRRVQGPDPNYNDICFSGAGSDTSQLSKYFPSVEMVFDNGQKISLSPENYLFRHSKLRGAYCLGIFQNGKDPTTLLGGIVVRNTLVTYDREHERIGFWKTNCSELWERLHMSSSPPPAVTGSNETNSTVDKTPYLAPSQPPPPEAPLNINVGLITFNMLFNLTYPELQPQLSEIAPFLAKDLSVNASQVRLMNATSKDNDTLLGWAIYPKESDDFISDEAVKEIIHRLNESRVYLPDRFGKYKFIEWKVVPKPERSWWKEHQSVIIVGALVMCVCGLLAFGAWRMWRKEHSLLSYKPVDTVIVAEQELQPLQN